MSAVGPALHHIRRLVRQHSLPPLSDRELLHRFVEQRDANAFGALCATHKGGRRKREPSSWVGVPEPSRAGSTAVGNGDSVYRPPSSRRSDAVASLVRPASGAPFAS